MVSEHLGRIKPVRNREADHFGWLFVLKLSLYL